jgi:hypothetical protein
MRRIETLMNTEDRDLVEIIKIEFSFLVERGFDIHVENENSVKYSNSQGVFVRVFRDSNDKYVGFRVGLLSRPRDALTATELARLAGVTNSRGEFPVRKDQLHASVATIAHQLQAHGERALTGEIAIFDEAKELRRAYTRPFTGAGHTREELSDDVR